MPIKPENKDLYPKDWDAIRTQALVTAGNRCEWEKCRVNNYARGARDTDGVWWNEDAIRWMDEGAKERIFGTKTPKIIRIILTIAHLDHNPQNNDPSNLAALCQLHHNRYDREHRAETRRATIASRLKRSQDVVDPDTLAHNSEGWSQVEMDLPLGPQDGENKEAAGG